MVSPGKFNNFLSKAINRSTSRWSKVVGINLWFVERSWSVDYSSLGVQVQQSGGKWPLRIWLIVMFAEIVSPATPTLVSKKRASPADENTPICPSGYSGSSFAEGVRSIE
jgi:hypothetical protein